MFVRRFPLQSPDADAGASGGIPSDPQAPDAGGITDAMHFADDEPQDDVEPQDDGQEPQDDASAGAADAGDDGQQAQDDGTEPPAADPVAPPAPKAAPKLDPVTELAQALKVRDEQQQRRYDEFMQRQEQAAQAQAEAQQRAQAAAATQRRRAEFDAQVKAMAPPMPSPDAPVEQILQWQQQMADYAQRAAEARANFTMQERMEQHLSAQEGRIRAMEERTRAAEHQAEARAAEMAVDRDLAQIHAIPEMAWIKNPEVEREFFGYWNSLLQASGQPVSGIDAARRFMRMFSVVVPHVRQNARKPAPAAPPAQRAPQQQQQRPRTPGGSPAPRGAARAGAQAPEHWSNSIKF